MIDQNQEGKKIGKIASKEVEVDIKNLRIMTKKIKSINETNLMNEIIEINIALLTAKNILRLFDSCCII